MAVYRDVQPGDTLRIGDTIIEVAHKTGQRARLRIESKLDVEHIKAGARPAMTHPNLPPAPPAAAAPTAQAEPAKRPRLTLPPMPLPA